MLDRITYVKIRLVERLGRGEESIVARLVDGYVCQHLQFHVRHFVVRSVCYLCVRVCVK